MIGRLTGMLATKQPPWLLVDVGGVGYEVEAPLSTIFQLGECGSEVVLHIHMVVREDAQLLYGFATEAERRLFRNLIRASGIGPKLALTILSGLGAEDFWRAVREDDTAVLIKLPGVGRKTAERLLVEMRDRAEAEGMSLAASTNAGGTASSALHTAQDEARAALQALGYKPSEADKLVDAVHEDGMAADALLRAALRRAVR
ncbi:Holliday junction branch migration protein RuvA [Algiphilus sp.]|uniref:Holliday junction branch migration protein RuvA n=1 Tax=Algiphilus sp. TaxID=1872431 RepID=UPI0032EBDE70